MCKGIVFNWIDEKNSLVSAENAKDRLSDIRIQVNRVHDYDILIALDQGSKPATYALEALSEVLAVLGGVFLLFRRPRLPELAAWMATGLLLVTTWIGLTLAFDALGPQSADTRARLETQRSERLLLDLTKRPPMLVPPKT